MGIKWAPIFKNVPFHRRLELLAAGIQMYTLLFGELICLCIFLLLLVKGNFYIQTLCFVYIGFIYYDRRAGDCGGRGTGCEWQRNWIIWKYFVDYFPVDLVKTVDLPSNQHYLFAVFPHGILGTGSFANFNTNYSKWRQLFPGIRSKMVTLNFHLMVPIFRELILGWGMAAASANSIITLLTQSNDPKNPSNRDNFTSNGVMLLVGGAREAIHSQPQNYTFILKSRRGFIRIAAMTGTSIVPVISFGETNIFDQTHSPPGSRVRKCQEWFKRATGIAPVMFNGRGFFQYSFGWVPKRRPITTVVGEPIEVKKIPRPTIDDLNGIHSVFCEKLIDLFETHKEKYVKDSKNVHLKII